MSDELNVLQELAILFPIPASFRRQARDYALQYFVQDVQHRIYCNTLAVLVAEAYFRLLGFETNLAKPARWKAFRRLWSEANELELPGLGNLECRCITTGQQTATLPPEALNDRIGYLFIEIESSEKLARLIGFLPAFHSEPLDIEVAIADLQSMDDLIDYLVQQESSSPAEIAATSDLTREFAEARITYLRNWLDSIYTPDWEPSRRSLRAATCKKKILLAGRSFEMELSVSQDSAELILVRVVVRGEDASLPQGMQVSVPDEADIYTETVNETADLVSIPLEFSPGEEFWVELRLGENSCREYFIA
jgi:Protein of unknown function (DUF1822)